MARSSSVPLVPQEWSPTLYSGLLAAIRAHGVAFVTDWSTVPSPGQLLLRHDIDVSLSCAWQCAQLEHSLGVSATYFVHLDSPYYNAISLPSSDILRRIAGLGHRLGLHVSLDQRATQAGISSGYAVVLEYGLRVDPVVSFHHVSRSRIAVDPGLLPPGFHWAHGPEIFAPAHYLSDSRASWGPSLNHFISSPAAIRQLLLHPVWWFANGCSAGERLADALRRDYEQALQGVQPYFGLGIQGSPREGGDRGA